MKKSRRLVKGRKKRRNHCVSPFRPSLLSLPIPRDPGRSLRGATRGKGKGKKGGDFHSICCLSASLCSGREGEGKKGENQKEKKKRWEDRESAGFRISPRPVFRFAWFMGEIKGRKGKKKENGIVASARHAGPRFLAGRKEKKKN